MTDQAFATADVVREIAAELGRTPAQVALNWVTNRPQVTSSLIGARTLEPASTDYRYDLDAILAAITPKTRLIFIANPNNPTGTLVSQTKIDNFIARVPGNIVTVFDEAYFEFLDNPPYTLRYVREGGGLGGWHGSTSAS